MRRVVSANHDCARWKLNEVYVRVADPIPVSEVVKIATKQLRKCKCT